MNSRALRITKWVALGLIVLPEPITTVIGLSILAGTGYLARKSNSRMIKTEKIL